MRKFVFERIKQLSGDRFKVLQLSINGVNQLDTFELEMEDGYKIQYANLMAYIERYTHSGTIPGAKIKDITPAKEKRKQFEFRTNNGIRLYAVQADDGRLIVLCGYKGNQKKDISRLRNLIKEVFPD